MDKKKFRRMIKRGKGKILPDIDISYEFDPVLREFVSNMLEKELEDSLNRLEKNLQKRATL